MYTWFSTPKARFMTEYWLFLPVTISDNLYPISSHWLWFHIIKTNATFMAMTLFGCSLPEPSLFFPQRKYSNSLAIFLSTSRFSRFLSTHQTLQSLFRTFSWKWQLCLPLNCPYSVMLAASALLCLPWAVCVSTTTCPCDWLNYAFFPKWNHGLRGPR